MKVYRIERRDDGVGPYSIDNWAELWCDPRAHADNDHPSWIMDKSIQDGIRGLTLREKEEYYCGFSYLTDLFVWFSSSNLEKLHKLDFVLTIYEIDKEHVIEGKSQTIFKKALGKRIQIINIWEAMGNMRECI